MLKAAWARFGMVRMKEIDDRTMEFEFQSEKDQIMDMSLWLVQGPVLKLIDSKGNISMEEVDFTRMQMWVQIHGLSLEMHNPDNARSIGNSIGRCISVEEDNVVRNRTFLRIKVERDVTVPLSEGIWWTNKSGEEKWATIKYERLSDVCYGCGRLGHTSTNYGEEVRRSEVRPEFPKFGPWLVGTRPRTHSKWYHVGGMGETSYLEGIRIKCPGGM